MNENILTVSNLKRYLSGVLDTELNLYVQKQTLERMENTYSGLGRHSKIYKPSVKKANTVVADYMVVSGVVCGILLGIIVGIVQYVNSDGGFLKILTSFFDFCIYAVLGFIVGGLVIGGIIGILALNKENEQLQRDYEQDMKQYNREVDKDKNRVRNEEVKKVKLLKEINALKKQISETQHNLAMMYGYDILDRSYQNIFAVSSIYDYVQKGRTQSLQFNEKTGDQGAYNIYENELRMNIIITNTYEIMDRLDEISNNQYELAQGLKKANSRIDSLCGDLSEYMNSTSKSIENIERCQSIIAYNTEQTKNELEFMSWLHVMYN